MIEELENNYRVLILVLSRHFSEGTEHRDENSVRRACVLGEIRNEPPEYESRALPLRLVQTKFCLTQKFLKFLS